jgi:hypothetical protein
MPVILICFLPLQLWSSICFSKNTGLSATSTFYPPIGYLNAHGHRHLWAFDAMGCVLSVIFIWLV